MDIKGGGSRFVFQGGGQERSRFQVLGHSTMTHLLTTLSQLKNVTHP